MIKPVYQTTYGKAYCTDSLNLMAEIKSNTIDLVITSPPFALRKKKSYGNVKPEEYLNWFLPFAKEIYRILKYNGSFILDIGGAWNKGQPTRSLYHYELLLKLCNSDRFFKLAQEFYWYNPAKMPTPAQWVTIKRIRVKDAVNPVWWLAKTNNPRASNRRVLKPYSKSMESLLRNGYNSGLRPSGHIVSKKWDKRHKGAIPPNIIIASNTRSSDNYISDCKKYNLEVHPARFVNAVPEFFIRFLTLKNNIVFDPFAGSNVVGKIAEDLNRKWISNDINLNYVIGSSFRFKGKGAKVYNKFIKNVALS